ncbi:MAG TPA: hypothetical protein VGM16_00365 [Gammaproteobacteria bacterium]|jgi:hypothetical protein
MIRALPALALLAATLPFAAHAADAKPALHHYCDDPVYHQLDFWIGDWDTIDMQDHPDGKGPSIAHAVITPMVDGCALHEKYEQVDGLIGESYTLYVKSLKRWHQSWVTNGASLWLQDGDFKDGVLTLAATTTAKDGSEVRHKITWAKQGADVREVSVASTDGGKTWNPEFDCLFVKHKG